MLDPRRSHLKALRLDGDRYSVEADLDADGRFRPSRFPRLTLRMRDVFAD